MMNWIHKCNTKRHQNHKNLRSVVEKKLLKIVCVYYTHLKTVESRNTLFSWQKLCEYRPISFSAWDQVRDCIAIGNYQHVLSIVVTYNALW